LLVEGKLVTRDRSRVWLRGFRVHPAARGATTLDEALHALPESCALDVTRSNPDGLTFDQTARLLGVTRERVRQIEATALAKMLDEARRE
jgi:DNA-directed RNA polymerase specialized sigma24 family protein